MDADHVGDLPPAIRATGARQAGATALAQAGDKLAAQFTARQGVDGRVDGFVGHVATRLVGEDPLEGTRDLLGRPLPVQQGQHQAPGEAVQSSLAAGRAARRRAWHDCYATWEP
jgi:hypothetical protein